MVRYARAAVIAAAAAVLACGCSRKNTVYEPDTAESSLYLTSEGTVTSVDVETYEADYYDAAELKASVEEALSFFNGAHAGKKAEDGSEIAAATLLECDLKDGTALLSIRFMDPASYLEFEEEYPDPDGAVQVTNLDVTTVSDAITKGYLVGETFQNAGDSDKTASSGEIAKEGGLYVAAVWGKALIQTDGEIRYASQGASLLGANKAETPEGQVTYLVFR